MRIIFVSGEKELENILKEINVDPYGIKIMAPKAINALIRINGVSPMVANILKQEMLSLGGDVAVSKDVLIACRKKTDCLLIGTLSQLKHLIEKLRIQPFGLRDVSAQLTTVLTNYQQKLFCCNAKGVTIRLGARTHLMGILNVTPDSFSGDGVYRNVDAALARIEALVADGADSIDIGGESSRPGAKPVPLKEELARTIPVIKRAVKITKVPLSIDTRKPEVAKAALDNGACLVNDVTGLRSPAMAKVIAHYKAGVVIMHMRGTPKTMQANPRYGSLMDELLNFLSSRIDAALDAGIERQNIIVDPGIGFGKTLEHNLQILQKLSELKSLGRPILVGPSRKSFILKICADESQERSAGTIASCVLAAAAGAHMVRVHDVRQARLALKVADAITHPCSIN